MSDKFPPQPSPSSPQRLRILRDEVCCLPVLKVQGAVDDENWDALELMLQQVSREGHQHLGLDLSDVSSMSPTSAGLLRTARTSLAARFQSLSLTGLSPAVILALGSV